MKKAFFLLIFFIRLHNATGQPIDTSVIRAMETSIADGTYPNIHSILISHKGKLIYEKYWPGGDEKFGKYIGVVPHGVDSLHCLRSMTKSVTSACVGIALQQGKIKSIDQRIFEFFPEYASQDTAWKSQITVRHLLTMTAGFQWDESALGTAESSETIMGNATDPVAYMFSLPMANAPGKTFLYNGGATQLLAAIIHKARVYLLIHLQSAIFLRR